MKCTGCRAAAGSCVTTALESVLSLSLAILATAAVPSFPRAARAPSAAPPPADRRAEDSCEEPDGVRKEAEDSCEEPDGVRKEKEIEEIKRRLEALEGSRQRADPQAQASAPAPEKAAADRSSPASNEGWEDELELDTLGLGLVARYEAVEAAFQFFGDAGYRYRNPGTSGGSQNSFLAGSLDVFTTAHVGEHFQVLSESVIQVGRDDFAFTQQRLHAGWTFSDLLYAKLGLEHTPTSRWNRLYHHGKWLETSIERPLLSSFEGEEGILAGHFVGLELGGAVGTNVGLLKYTGVVSNGRGVDPRDRGTVADRNSDKAFEVSLAFSPACCEGLTFGGSARVDNIPENPADAMRDQTFRELIGSAFVELYKWNVQTLAEFLYIDHKDRETERHFNHHAAYVQVGYRLGDFTPYTRFDLRAMEQGDLFYQATNRDLDKLQQIFGLRWDFTDNAALKAEFLLGREEVRDSGGSVDRRDFIGAALQIAWVF